jgi:hypothetical protein
MWHMRGFLQWSLLPISSRVLSGRCKIDMVGLCNGFAVQSLLNKFAMLSVSQKITTHE